MDLASVKSTGALLQVNVLFNCLLLFSKCEPTISVTRLDGVGGATPGYSIWRAHKYVDGSGSRRDLEKLSGIRMVWRSVGSGNQIDLPGVVFFIAVGVALLPIAAFVTEFVMLFVLPERRHYEDKIFKKMPDFYQLDELKAERDEAEARRKERESAVDVEALLAEPEEP